MKKIVFTFGRFNPPTTGHLLLATKVKEEARRRGAEHAIFGSSSTDKKKNPLSPRDKERYMKKVLKGFNVLVDPKANTPFVLLKKLSDEGYTDVTMVVGSDRVAEFQKIVPRYIGKEYMFTNFEVVSAGDRDPDAEGVQGMSASKMRSAAAEGNLQAFLLGLPSHVSERDSKGLFAAVQKGMGIKPFIEESWFDYSEFAEFYEGVKGDRVKQKHADEKSTLLQRHTKERETLKIKMSREKHLAKRSDIKTDPNDRIRMNNAVDYSDENEVSELTVMGRKKLQRSAKRTAKKRARSRKRKEGRRKSKDQIKVKANKAAVGKIRKKLIRGRDWGSLSFQEREKVDKKLQAKKGLISKISKKLMPQMQKAEQERLKKVKARMTTNDPAKAVEGLDTNFLDMINEVSSVDQESRRRAVEREQNRGTGTSTPKERDAARKRGERDSADPWDQVLAVRDRKENIKLILTHDYNPEQHDEVILGKAPGEKPKPKANAGKAGRLSVDPDFKWTVTAKKLLGWEQQKKSMEQQAQQQVAQQGQAGAQAQQQVAPEEIPPPELTPAKRVPKDGKKIIGKGSIYDDWDHKAVDIEAGFVHVWNNDNSVSAKVGLISDGDQQKIKQSETLNDSSQRLVDTIREQVGEDFEAVHFGRSSEPLTGAWKDNGGTDSTPKTDLMLKNKKTGENIRVSVKCGDAQLMSAKKGEATATLKNVLNKHGAELKKEPQTVKKINKMLDEMEKGWVTTAATPAGSPGEHKVSRFLPGGDLAGQIPEITKTDAMHKEHTIKFQELMENSPTFKRAIIHEAMTGEMKFGKDSDATATHVMSMNKDGTRGKLIKIDPDYIDKVALPANINILTRFKSSQKIAAGKRKTGAYSYWTALGMIVKAKGFMEWISHTTLLAEEENGGTIQDYMKKVKSWVGSDVSRLQEFLGVEIDAIETNSFNLADLNVEESGEYTDVVIDGIRKRIPVEKDPDYHEAEEEPIEEGAQLLREPEILDRLVTQLQDKGMDKNKAYAVATSQLQKNGVLKTGSQDLTSKGEKRNAMGPEGRAKDRAAKRSGKTVSDYKYNPKTNAATLKDAYLFNESPTHGMGSFATEDISKNQRVGMYYLNITEDIPQYQRTDFCRLTNHSTKSNLKLEGIDGNFYATATRDIEEGEELFIDYFHVAETIIPRLGQHGAVIVEVLRWTDGYDHIEIGEDNFGDLRNELEYLKSLDEGEDPKVRAARQAKYNSTPEQRERRSSRTGERNKRVRRGQLKIGDGNDIHHKDGNPLNNSSTNTVVIPAGKNRAMDNNKNANEEGGAGEWGTNKLRKNYTKKTPGMTINSLDEAFNRIK